MEEFPKIKSKGTPIPPPIVLIKGPKRNKTPGVNHTQEDTKEFPKCKKGKKNLLPKNKNPWLPFGFFLKKSKR